MSVDHLEKKVNNLPFTWVFTQLNQLLTVASDTALRTGQQTDPGPVEKCVFVVKGDDSPLSPIRYINRLPGRIGPPQKEKSGILREGDDSPLSPIRYINKLPGRIGPPQKERGIFQQAHPGKVNDDQMCSVPKIV